MEWTANLDRLGVVIYNYKDLLQAEYSRHSYNTILVL